MLMQKRRKLSGTVSLLLAVAGAFAALYFVNQMDAANSGDVLPPPEIPETIYVLGGDFGTTPAPLTVQVKNEHGLFTVVNTNPDTQTQFHDYTLDGFEGLPLAELPVNTVADRARSLTASAIISEDGENLAQYGLLSPAATVTISYLDGTSAMLYLGNAAPGENSGTYAKVEGSPIVYLIPQSSAKSFLHCDLDLVSVRITPQFSRHPPEPPVITKAILGGTLREEPIVIEQIPVDEGISSGGMLLTTHMITSPMQKRLHNIHGFEPVISSYSLVAKEVVARLDSHDKLIEWGLDEPYSTVEITSPTHESFKLCATAPDENGLVYLMREGLPLVYLVDKYDVPWLRLTIFEMMDKLVILPFIDSVSRLEVRMPLRAINFVFKGEGGELTVSVDGEPYADITNLRTLYGNFISASYESPTEEPLPDSAAMLLSYAYHYRDGRAPDTVTFYKGAARRVFVQLNDEPPMLALSAYVDHISRSVESFLAGEQVASYL